MVFKRLPGRFGTESPFVGPVPAAGPVRPGGPPRDGARETQLTQALRCALAAGEIGVALSANPGGPDGVLKADRQGGLPGERHGTPGKAEVGAGMRQVTGVHAGAVAARAADRNRGIGNGIARAV